jgi:hypothetical protein
MSTLIMAGSQVYCLSGMVGPSRGEINHVKLIMAGSQVYCISSMMARWAPVQERSIMSTLIMAGSQVYLQHDGTMGPSTGEINHVKSHHGRVPGISPA